MKRSIVLALALACALIAQAVPAYRGWQTLSQPDGTTLQARQNGDEYYHYWTDTAGHIIEQDENGYWHPLDQQPTDEQIYARRRTSPIWQTTPQRTIGKRNLAPRGIVILVNFSDVAFLASNTHNAIDSMLNADNYTYNGAYGSAKRYFSDQSNGTYLPQFDVVGPVTLANNCEYYGKDVSGTGWQDQYVGNMIVEACKLAYSQYGTDFTLYDNDNDGKIDLVYVLYAGKGQSDGGGTNTIWPHNWTITAARTCGNCTYSASECQVGGKTIDNYACSGELSGRTGKRSGIGTFCHEFSHVLGLPDYYDTSSAKTNDTKGILPDKWSLMDQGSYNENGNYPPNYSTHDKYFMGWSTPTNPKTKKQILTLSPIGTPDGVGYQINESGIDAGYSATSTQYYIENRQQTGWDKGLPGHGLLIWQVKYNQTIWTNNQANASTDNPRYTILPADAKTANYGTSSDPFPGTAHITEWTVLAGKPLLNITENADNTVSVTYIQDPATITEWEYLILCEHCTADPESGTVEAQATLTIHITPDEGYYIAPEMFQITMDDKELQPGTDFTYTAGTLTIPSVTGDIDIILTAELQPTADYTVTWIADGNMVAKQSYAKNATLVLPNEQDIPVCTGKTFIGWSAQRHYSDPFCPPQDLFTSANEQKVTDNKTFYAIYRLTK